MKRVSHKEAGDIVFAELSKSDSTKSEGTARTGLTSAQWTSGLEYIRDVLAELNVEPVLYDARTKRYSLALTDTEADAYIGKRVLTFLVQLRRLYNGSFVPAGLKFSTQLTLRFRQLDKDITSLITQLDLVREELGIPESAALRKQRTDRNGAGLS